MTNPNTQPLAISCVFYDANCPLCRREVALYKKLADCDRARREKGEYSEYDDADIKWIDINHSETERKKAGIEYCEEYDNAVQIIHVKGNSGIHCIDIKVVPKNLFKQKNQGGIS